MRKDNRLYGCMNNDIYSSNNIKSQDPFSKTLRESNPGNHSNISYYNHNSSSCSCRYGYNTERPVTMDTDIRIVFILAGVALLLPYTLRTPGLVHLIQACPTKEIRHDVVLPRIIT